jgi:hypothetical protein
LVFLTALKKCIASDDFGGKKVYRKINALVYRLFNRTV